MRPNVKRWMITLLTAVIVGSAGWVASIAAQDRRAGVAAERYALATEAMRQIEENASAQLAVEAMLAKMRAV